MDATPTGVLLFCRADPDEAAAPARLLRERGVLAPAGAGWSLLVPEGRPWRDGSEPVERIATGWATALAVGGPWPVVALWWDRERAATPSRTGSAGPSTTPGSRTAPPRARTRPCSPSPSASASTRSSTCGTSRRSPAPTRTPTPAPASSASSPCSAASGWSRRRGCGPARPPSACSPPPGPAPARGTSRAATRATPYAPDRPPGLDGPEAAARILRAVAALQLAAGPPLLVWSLTRRAPAPGWAAAGALLTVQGALGLGLARRARGRRAVP